MDILDGVIVIVAIVAIVRGVELGLVRQLFSGLGFFGGLLIGIWAQTRLIHLAHSSNGRAALAISIILGCAFLLLIVGEYIGDVLKFRLSGSWLNKFDRLLGSFAAVIIVVATLWLGVNTFASFPSIGWQGQVQNSRIVSALNNVLPAAPSVIARIGRVVSPNGFPKVFNGVEPALAPRSVSQPNIDVLVNAVHKDKASVVKIEGQGCGGIVEGSGFVAGEGMVITNAHVVAGVQNPQIFDTNGKHSTQVIWFDPNLDVAVLHAENLAGAPLGMNARVANAGMATAALGYPEGGGFTASPAGVINSFEATGQNIYNAKTVSRQIYSLNATILPGNSGGPLVDTSGTVVGLVFARSARYDSVGYALTMQKVIDEFTQATQRHTTVSTGDCAD
ncbi:MAG TPA: MarP family serine protease [Candidatus Saccharimonadales bacterium]|nr:MarP family serine protease [Candidatus Saccharimonadales bacterium]